MVHKQYILDVMNSFEAAYKGLNARQKEAVDTIEGPVMVIAGPGTGKTQVISLRIGNILKSTDTQADGVLCLTFTNAGVEAMRTRLREYIGPEAYRVEISTFHAFGIKLIEEFHHALGFSHPPRLLDESETIALVDRILSTHEWKHIRPRNNAALYYRDLKSLISILIRERLSPEDFLNEIKKDIEKLKNDPENLSSRGPTKGKLKADVLSRIESLEKTCEVTAFYKLYEEGKREEEVMDYDDVLRYMVELVAESEDARDTVRERYLYVLVDEHQDSSGVQNQFLREVWGDVDSPNVFVVGDDRQLIYGFSGASLSYFEEFKETFRGTKIITLTDNYRSTQDILDLADILLTSHLAEGKLRSQSKLSEPIELIEAAYPRDEILAAGLYFKQKIEEGLAPEDCALLVPKNALVRSASGILRDIGLPVSASGTEKLFAIPDARSFITILRVIASPFSSVDVAESMLDPLSGVSTLEAHTFLHSADSRKLSVRTLLEEGDKANLLKEASAVYAWGKKLSDFIDISRTYSVYELLQHAGKMFLLDTAADHDAFVRRAEIVRSFLHLSLSLEEKGEENGLKTFTAFLERLEEYGEDIPLAVFGAGKGIQVKTMHGSKGLEYEAVWIAHMNEKSLMSGARLGFSLPEKIAMLEAKKDEAAAKREVYVAITRAKRFCVLSYAHMSHRGSAERLAAVVEALPQEHFIFASAADTEAMLMKMGVETMVTSGRVEAPQVDKKELQELVKESYAKKRVSVTLLNNFFECPWKWYFRSFLEVPEPLSESLEFGSVVHAAIERIVTLLHAPSKAEIDAALTEAIEECHIIDETRIRRMMREAEAAVKRFVESVYPELWEHRESERSLGYKDPEFPHLSIYGKLDLVERHEGDGVRVTDFKTGKTRKASEIEKIDEEGRMSTYMRQLAMYSYLVHHAMKGQAEIEASRLYFVEEPDTKKACFEAYIDEEKIDLLIQDIEDYDALMQSGEWTERECQYKGHQGEPDCPYCAKAKMYK